MNAADDPVLEAAHDTALSLMHSEDSDDHERLLAMMVAAYGVHHTMSGPDGRAAPDERIDAVVIVQSPEGQSRASTVTLTDDPADAMRLLTIGLVGVARGAGFDDEYVIEQTRAAFGRKDSSLANRLDQRRRPTTTRGRGKRRGR